VTVAPRAIDLRSPVGALGGLIPHARYTTVVILLINTALFAAMLFRGSISAGGMDLSIDGRTLVDFGAKFGPYIVYRSEWWRLVTAGFLHGGILHILMNSWVLFDLGAQVEETYGTARYLVFYFVSTITGFLASLYWSPNTPSIGASAALCGLIGAMIAMGIRDRSSYGDAIKRDYIRWFIYILIFGIFVGGIDNAAHIGGLAGGFAIGYIAGVPGRSRAVEGTWRVLAALSLAITAFSFYKMAMAMIASRPQ
jgi:rhomboid protease GluP